MMAGRGAPPLTLVSRPVRGGPCSLSAVLVSFFLCIAAQYVFRSLSIVAQLHQDSSPPADALPKNEMPQSVPPQLPPAHPPHQWNGGAPAPPGPAPAAPALRIMYAEQPRPTINRGISNGQSGSIGIGDPSLYSSPSSTPPPPPPKYAVPPVNPLVAAARLRGQARQEASTPFEFSGVPGMVSAAAHPSGLTDAVIALAGAPVLGGTDVSPVDVVYTFVNSSDPVWGASYAAALEAAGECAPPCAIAAHSKANKFREWDELRYSMRSLELYAPWVRNVILVVSGPSQVPTWLDTAHPRIRVVYHADIFPDPSTQLPTFNSNAIESVLWRIPGLSPRFLYLNNDVFLGQPVLLEDFISPTTGAYVKYVDWFFMVPKPCRWTLYPSVLERGLDNPDLTECKQSTYMLTDVLVSLTVWGRPVVYGFLHAPHLWETRLGAAVEAAIPALLNTVRGNKFRNVVTDIIIHVQYESFREALTIAHNEPHVVQKRRKNLKLRDAPAFSYATFNNGDSDFFYRQLAAEFLISRPVFFALDDTLSKPSDAVVASHARFLRTFFGNTWPNAVEWERLSPPRAPTT